MWTAESIPKTIKEKRISTAKALCNPFTKRKREAIEDHECYLHYPCLIIVMRNDRCLSRSVSGAGKLTRELDRMSAKFSS